jgi:hypothetical protein
MLIQHPGLLIWATLFLTACGDSANEYVAAATITRDGFAREGAELGAMQGEDIRVWGYVDEGNVYSDSGGRGILGDLWSGEPRDPSTWRFGLKAHREDDAGHSFAVIVRSDKGRDALLRTIVANARAGRPTRAYVTGTVHTFAAPTNAITRTGLYVVAAGSLAISLEPPPGGMSPGN